MLDENNRKLYKARSIVQHYTQLRMLQPAEQTVLDRFQNQWSSIRMLDIGVGGGRTTQHFSKLVLEYVGIDYSTEMIEACQKRFAASPHIAFEVCDARDMSRFGDNSFDFIMFSFNGIDYVSHADRLKVFQEVSRVSKPGGYFFFSSHNLQRIEREFNWRNQMSLNPITTYVNLVMLTLLRCFNYSTTLEQLNMSTHAIIKDESHNFRLKTCYVRPQAQINQLEASFSDIQVYSWENGLELKTENEWSANTDMWLYYLCTIK
ncbi:class I SAM-dependent methyltransferase [Cyanobacteria bacterium FACHB-471]|nr:class I SAM-dependent methyltransferase [Cyanobacteria bacterium FACHB-471]